MKILPYNMGSVMVTGSNRAVVISGNHTTMSGMLIAVDFSFLCCQHKITLLFCLPKMLHENVSPCLGLVFAVIMSFGTFNSVFKVFFNYQNTSALESRFYFMNFKTFIR